MLQFTVTANTELIELLRRRESVIADHAWRDSDPDGQFAALKQVSEQISNWASSHHDRLDPRLRHFLANASFQKALAHVLDASAS